MGRKVKNTATSNRELSVKETSSYTNKSTVIISVIVAALAYALYHLFSIGAHLDWIDSPPPAIQVEKYVVNDSISYHDIAESHNPCVLLGSVADRWRARQEWNIEFLKTKIPHVMAYR